MPPAGTRAAGDIESAEAELYAARADREQADGTTAQAITRMDTCWLTRTPGKSAWIPVTASRSVRAVSAAMSTPGGIRMM
jgi:hypothetical protein